MHISQNRNCVCGAFRKSLCVISALIFVCLCVVGGDVVVGGFGGGDGVSSESYCKR